jgi:hypothetical protein
MASLAVHFIICGQGEKTRTATMLRAAQRAGPTGRIANPVETARKIAFAKVSG